jgi:hypothetical protein
METYIQKHFLLLHSWKNSNLAMVILRVWSCKIVGNILQFFSLLLYKEVQLVGLVCFSPIVSHPSCFQTIFLVELERQFRDSNCKVVFCADKSIDRVLKAAKQCRNIKVHINNIRKNYIRLGYCRNPYSKIYQNRLSIWCLCI